MTERAFLVRGAAAGAGAMLVAVVIGLAFVVALSGDPGPGWADRHALTGVLLTALWCLAAAGAGAVGAWQAAAGGAPDHAAARRAGALGPAVLIVLASLSTIGGAPAAVVAIEALVELAAAVAGAAALARRLEPHW